MKHFSRILATTDLSPESLSAVRYAIHLAKAQGAKVTVVHVPATPATLFPEFGVPVNLTALFREIEESATRRLAQWIKRNAKSVPVDCVVRHGITHETICRVADEIRAGLIVMSTHGRSGVGHLLLGSVTERVLREAPCPVLVVRPSARALPKRKAA